MKIINEYYHIYNRGAHKSLIFLDKSDYDRFWALLYIANSKKPLPKNWFKEKEWPNILDRNILVDIFSYCLMPNHYHLGLFEVEKDGIRRFTHKLVTAYTMYFNKKYNHPGTIFQGRYKYKHVNDDKYFNILLQYIHLNPYGVIEPDLLNTAKVDYLEEAITFSKEYEYSSFKDYLGIKRVQNNILSIRGSNLGLQTDQTR